jgi:hypothetical protein
LDKLLKMNKQKNLLFERENFEHCVENGIRKTTLGALFSVPLALLFASRNFNFLIF